MSDKLREVVRALADDLERPGWVLAHPGCRHWAKRLRAALADSATTEGFKCDSCLGWFTDGTEKDGECGNCQDLHMVMGIALEVYDHVTGGRISKPNTHAIHIIGEADDLITRLVDEGVQDELEALKASATADAPPETTDWTAAHKTVRVGDAPPEPTEEMVALFQEWLGATITFRSDELVSRITKRTRQLLSVLTE